MAVLTTSSVFPPAVRTYYDRRQLMRAVPMLLFMQIAYRRSLARRNGDTMLFRRVNGLPLALAPLVEGTPPTGTPLSKTDVSSVLQQYGDVVTMTDFGRMIVENDMLNDAADVLGEQGGQSLDALLRDVCVAGTNVMYGGAATQRSEITTTTHKVDTTLLDRAVRALDTQNTKRFKEMVSASTKVQTFPLRPAYIGMCHPELRFTIQSLSGFISIEKYATSDERLIGEFGAYNDIRFCYSTHGKVFRGGGGTASGDVKGTGGNADVGVINIFGEQAVGVVPIEKGNMENIVKPLGSAGTADPLNQVATSGWKHTGTRLILNDLFMVRLEVAIGDKAP